MRCEDCRDAISARLDGEDPGGAPGAAVDRHLEGCADCRAFAERAAHVTRLTRLRPAEELPDVLPGLLDALDAGESRAELEPPGTHRTWRSLARDAVRATLAVLAVGQLALALSGIVAAAGAGPGHLAGASIAHLSHESAAWNLALGVAFAWAATGGRRAGGLVPVIGAFVVLLMALSAMDLMAGHVEPARLAGHVPVVVGLVLLLLHSRLVRDGGGSSGSVDAGSAADHPVGGFGGRVDGDGYAGGGLQPTARHRAA